MKKAFIFLAGALVVCGPTLAQASISVAGKAPLAKPAAAGMLLAKNGADNAPGDNGGAKGGGSGRGGHDDGANHH